MKKQLLVLAVSTACATSAQAQSFSARIINGSTAQPSAYPWMVSLRQGGEQFCGASLIAPNWVLTAAHCVENESPKGMQAIVGDFDLSKADQGEQAREIKRIVIHGSRTGDDENHDIALLELDSPASNTPVTAASASLTDGIAAGTSLTVMGWGNRSTTGENFPEKLNEVKVPLVAQAQCQENYGGDVNDNMLCAGLAEGGKDSCQGDSGGPLVYQLDGQWHQLGIVSWGDACAAPNKPGVYARVGAYSEWISQVMSGEEDTSGSGGGGGDSGETDIEDGDWVEGIEEFPYAELPFELPAWVDIFSYDGGVSQESITFVNTSETAVSVSSVSADQEVFSIVENDCATSIKPQQSCDINIQYSPTEHSDLDIANLLVTVSDGTLAEIELYGENLDQLAEIEGGEGDWFASENEWTTDENDNAFVLNAWELEEGETSFLQAEFEGPGFLEFECILPDEDVLNRLVYMVDDKPVLTLKGGERTTGDHRTELSEGKHVVTWAYQKEVASSGQAKVRNVQFKPKADAASAPGGGGAGGPLALLGLLGALILRRARAE